MGCGGRGGERDEEREERAQVAEGAGDFGQGLGEEGVNIVVVNAAEVEEKRGG